MGLLEAHRMARTTSGTAERRWRDRVKRWRESGQSVRRFCWREGVSEPSFYQWRKRLSADLDSGRSEQAAVFVPLQVVDAPAARGAAGGGAVDSLVEVVLPGGVVIRGGTLVDESRWRGVLRAVLAETGGC
jgi:hypothetical protein